MRLEWVAYLHLKAPLNTRVLLLTDSKFLANPVAVLISLLMPENMDAMVEACRVFGNFSRSKDVRALLAEHKGKRFQITVYVVLS